MRFALRIGIVVVALVLGLGALLGYVLVAPAPLALPERGATLENVTVVRPGVGREAHRRVVVRGGEIASVEPVDPASGGAFAGHYVLPGLVDMHVHFPPKGLPGQTELFAFLFLLHGVTTVRDAGDVDGTATAPARDGERLGHFPGPRVRACGWFVDGEPPLWKNSLVARDPGEGRAAVGRIAADGFDCVKVYNELDAETLAAVRDAAHERGLPVIGHVPMRVPYADARLDDAQHLIGVAPPPSDPSLRFPFRLVAWDAVDDARLERVAAESVRSGIANTPTLVTVDRLLGMQDYAALREAPDAKLLPRFYREVVWNPQGGTSPAGPMKADDYAMVARAFERMKEAVRRLHAAGARIHTGSDTLIPFVVPGASLHRELRLLVEAGFTPEEAIALSTRDSAGDLGVPGLGEIRSGAPADLLVFREDPTVSLDALDSLVAVVRDGRLYPREALDAQMERYRAHFDGALYDAVVTPLVRQVLASTTRR